MRSEAIVQTHSRTQSSSAHDGQGETELTRGVRRASTGVEIAEKRAKRSIFVLPYPPTPGRGPLETNPHPRARSAGLVPGVARGNGYRSN